MIRLFYTGAASYLAEQRYSIQSLGGYISSSPVTNGVSDGFFSDISSLSLLEKNSEYRLFALKNESGNKIENLRIYYVYPSNNVIELGISCIKPSKIEKDNCIQFLFEKISSGKSAPIYSEHFFDASAQFASASLQFNNAAAPGEIITILGTSTPPAPADLSLEDTYEFVEQSFKNNQIYKVKFITEEEVFFNRNNGERTVNYIYTLLISKKDVGIYTSPVTFSTTGQVTIKESVSFSGGFDNSQSIGTLEDGQYIGIWIKKDILIKEFEKQEILTLEEIQKKYGSVNNIELFFQW